MKGILGALVAPQPSGVLLPALFIPGSSFSLSSQTVPQPVHSRTPVNVPSSHWSPLKPPLPWPARPLAKGLLSSADVPVPPHPSLQRTLVPGPHASAPTPAARHLHVLVVTSKAYLGDARLEVSPWASHRPSVQIQWSLTSPQRLPSSASGASTPHGQLHKPDPEACIAPSSHIPAGMWGFSGEPPSAPQAQASSSALAAQPEGPWGGGALRFVSSKLSLHFFMRYQCAGIRAKNIPICRYFHKKLTSESKSISIRI